MVFIAVCPFPFFAQNTSFVFPVLLFPFSLLFFLLTSSLEKLFQVFSPPNVPEVYPLHGPGGDRPGLVVLTGLQVERHVLDPHQGGVGAR